VTLHEWVAIATYPISDAEAERIQRANATGDPADPPIELGRHNLEAITAGCYRCEQPIDQAWGKPCPGDPSS
jgi:hypothetical protein